MLFSFTVAVGLFALSWATWQAAFDAPRSSAAGAQSVTRQFSPSASAAVAGRGDGNGYDNGVWTNTTRTGTAGGAFANDGNYVTDLNSTNTFTPGANTTCDGAEAEAHEWSTYSMDVVPGTASVSSITVRQNIEVDSLTGVPFTCAELSWNNGATYTTKFDGTNGTALAAATTTINTIDQGGAVAGWTGHTTWAGSELTDANFKVRSVNGTTGTGDRDFALYWIPVTVVFTAPFESYLETGRTTVTDDFSTNGAAVFLRGSNFPTGTYRVGYYDAGGTLKSEETGLTLAGGHIDSQVTPSAVGGTAGTWTAVISTKGTSLPATFGTLDHNTDLVVGIDTFTVNASAIPEFPTVVGGLLAAAAGAGAYLWLRRRQQSGAQLAA